MSRQRGYESPREPTPWPKVSPGPAQGEFVPQACDAPPTTPVTPPPMPTSPRKRNRCANCGKCLECGL